jgi:hypothetical protein
MDLYMKTAMRSCAQRRAQLAKGLRKEKSRDEQM